MIKERDEVSHKVVEALSHLDFRTRTVLCCRYGLSGENPLSLEETARVVEFPPEAVLEMCSSMSPDTDLAVLTAEDVRRIEAAGLRKLWRSCNHLSERCNQESLEITPSDRKADSPLSSSHTAAGNDAVLFSEDPSEIDTKA